MPFTASSNWVISTLRHQTLWPSYTQLRAKDGAVGFYELAWIPEGLKDDRLTILNFVKGHRLPPMISSRAEWQRTEANIRRERVKVSDCSNFNQITTRAQELASRLKIPWIKWKPRMQCHRTLLAALKDSFFHTSTKGHWKHSLVPTTSTITRWEFGRKMAS